MLVSVGASFTPVVVTFTATSLAEVVVPSNTYIATALAVSGVGATPVLVDCRRDTFNIDPALLRAALATTALGATLLGLRPDAGDVVDFGCGYGTFAIPAARIVTGTVFALDAAVAMS